VERECEPLGVISAAATADNANTATINCTCTGSRFQMNTATTRRR
jgi:hypothetical protein